MDYLESYRANISIVNQLNMLYCLHVLTRLHIANITCMEQQNATYILFRKIFCKTLGFLLALAGLLNAPLCSAAAVSDQLGACYVYIYGAFKKLEKFGPGGCLFLDVSHTQLPSVILMKQLNLGIWAFIW